jgi:AcrR family transcriptional regulator
MGRRSLVTERKRQILDAFERCIVKYGLESSSLDDVANEAGMSRSIIRHYVGNRDQLFDELVERITGDFIGHYRELFNNASDRDVRALIIDSLYTLPMGLAGYDVIVIDTLVLAQNRYPSVKRRLIEAFETVLEMYAAELRRIYPEASLQQRRSVAYAIFSLSIAHESMISLELDPVYTSGARENAAAIIDTLSGVRKKSNTI